MLNHPNSRRFGYGSRGGFTMIELLVVISIIAVLLSLILPAVMNVRSASRRLQCKNNLRNVAIAMRASTETRGRFPASGHWGPDGSGQVVPYHNWVVTLLPWLDQRGIYDAWNFDQPNAEVSNQRLAQSSIPVLTCPMDITVVGQGDLSFVPNGGLGWTRFYFAAGVPDCPVGSDNRPFDFNGDGNACPPNPVMDSVPNDKKLFFQTGMFFLENWKAGTTRRHHTPDTLSDGYSYTLMLAENVRVGYDPYFPGANWASSEPRRCSFYISSAVCRQSRCSAGNVDYSNANAGRAGINAALTQPEGEAPWPSSYHDGGVNVAFADGRVVFLSEDIDGIVYASLISPQGSFIDGPLRQPVISDANF